MGGGGGLPKYVLKKDTKIWISHFPSVCFINIISSFVLFLSCALQIHYIFQNIGHSTCLNN